MALPPRRATSISSDLAAGIVAATPQWHRYPRSWDAAAELIAAGTSPLVEAAFIARLRARVFDSCAPKLFHVLWRTLDLVVSSARAAQRPFHLADLDIPDFADYARHLQFLQWLAGPHAIATTATATIAEVATGATDVCGVIGIHTLSSRSAFGDQAPAHILVHTLCEVIRRNCATLQTVNIIDSWSAPLLMESVFSALGTCDRLTSLTLSRDCTLPESWRPRMSALHTLHGVVLSADGLTFQQIAEDAPSLRDLEVMWVGTPADSEGDMTGLIDVASRLYRLAIVDNRKTVWWAAPVAPATVEAAPWPEVFPSLREFAWRAAVDDGTAGPGCLTEIIWRSPRLRSLTAPTAGFLPLVPTATAATSDHSRSSDDAPPRHGLLYELRALRLHGGSVTDRILDAALRCAPHLKVLDMETAFMAAAALGGLCVGGAAAAPVQPHAQVVRLAMKNNHLCTPILAEDAGSGGIRVSKRLEAMIHALFPRLRVVTAAFENRRVQVPVMPRLAVTCEAGGKPI